MKFSYIICYRDNPNRLKNLIKTVDYFINNFPNIELILVEQDKSSKINNLTKKLFHKYIFTYSDRPFNRSWAFNVGATLSSNDKIYFGDSDLICPTNQMNKSIKMLDNYGCVSPYKTVIDLNESQSFKIDLNEWGNINKKGRLGTNITGGIVGFQKKEFYKISGWCEDFEGWGAEDDFMSWKVKNWITNYEIEGNVYHLYHPRPIIDQKYYQKNLQILHSVHNSEPKDIVNWINNSKYSIGDPYKHFKDINYSNYLKGKKIILVGPAPHTVGFRKKDFIESFDIIVRMNKSVPVPENRINDIGERTDIFYHSMNQNYSESGVINYDYLKDRIKFISSPYPNIFPFNKDIDRFNIDNKDRLKLHIINRDLFMKISNDMKTRPNTGVSAIIDLLSHDIKELYVTGITFFKGGYDKTYRDQSEEDALKRINTYKVHNNESQLNYIKNLYKKDNRFKVDNELKKILKNDKL